MFDIFKKIILIRLGNIMIEKLGIFYFVPNIFKIININDLKFMSCTANGNSLGTLPLVLSTYWARSCDETKTTISRLYTSSFISTAFDNKHSG